jgi:hypothetical protein
MIKNRTKLMFQKGLIALNPICDVTETPPNPPQIGSNLILLGRGGFETCSKSIFLHWRTSLEALKSIKNLVFQNH